MNPRWQSGAVFGRANTATSTPAPAASTAPAPAASTAPAPAASTAPALPNSNAGVLPNATVANPYDKAPPTPAQLDALARKAAISGGENDQRAWKYALDATMKQWNERPAQAHPTEQTVTPDGYLVVPGPRR